MLNGKPTEAEIALLKGLLGSLKEDITAQLQCNPDPTAEQRRSWCAAVIAKHGDGVADAVEDFLIDQIRLMSRRTTNIVVNSGGTALVDNKVNGDITVNNDNSKNIVPRNWEKLVGVIFAIGFLVTLTVRAFMPGRIEPEQFVLFRMIGSVALAGFAATVPGFLHVEVNKKGVLIRAGGAIAVFVIAYFFTPAK